MNKHSFNMKPTSREQDNTGHRVFYCYTRQNCKKNIDSLKLIILYKEEKKEKKHYVPYHVMAYYIIKLLPKYWSCDLVSYSFLSGKLQYSSS